MAEPILLVVANDVENIKADIIEIKGELKEANKQARLTYLTLVQYEAEIKPIRLIVFGLVGLILIAVVSAVIYLVVSKGGP